MLPPIPPRNLRVSPSRNGTGNLTATGKNLAHQPGYFGIRRFRKPIAQPLRDGPGDQPEEVMVCPERSGNVAGVVSRSGRRFDTTPLVSGWLCDTSPTHFVGRRVRCFPMAVVIENLARVDGEKGQFVGRRVVTKQARTVIGVIVLCVAFVLVALFVQKVKEVGVWLWLIPVAVAVGIGYLTYRHPAVRSGLGKTGVSLANVAGDVFKEDGTSKPGLVAERRSVSTAMRSTVMARAKYRCQYKGCTQSDRSILEIHHIDMNPAHSDDAANLIVVCPTCHAKLHREARSKDELQKWAQGEYRRSPRGYSGRS